MTPRKARSPRGSRSFLGATPFVCFVIALASVAFFTLWNAPRAHATGYHTITLDGNNDFAADEDVSGTGGSTWYFTWDATDFYFAIAAPDVASGSASQYVVLYLDSDPQQNPLAGQGSALGVTYNTQTPSLPFHADFHFRWRADNAYTNMLDWNNGTGSWIDDNTDPGNFGLMAFQNGAFVEFKIPRSSLGDPAAVYVCGAMLEEETGAENTFFVTPQSNGPEGFDRDFAHFFGFVLADGLSPDFAGNEDTYPAASTGSGNFSSASTWTNAAVPNGNSNVFILNGHTVTLDASGEVKHLTIVSGGTFADATGTALTLGGDFANHGLFTHNGSNVTFNGDGIRTVSGSAATAFNNITVNLGSSASVLDVLSPITIATNGLTLTQGTFRLSSASTITPFSGSSSIPAAATFHLNHADAVSSWGSSGSLTLEGALIIDNGAMNVGSGSGNELALTASTSAATINGGTLNLAGRVRVVSSGAGNGLTINSGEVVVTTVGNGSGTVAGFNMSATGKLTMTGGTVTIQRANTGAAGDVVLVSGSGTKSITGGVFRFGNGSTPAGQVLRINGAVPIFHFTVNSANVTAQLLSNALEVNGDLTISAGTLDANNLNINLAGNWTNNGAFLPGSGTVIFDGASLQTMSGSIFNDLTINNASGVRLLTGQTVNNTLTLLNGNVSTGANKMIIAPGGAVLRTGGHVVGNLQKNFFAGSNVTRTFEVGTGGDYTPVEVTISSVGTEGDVTASATVGDHPDLSTSNLNPAKSVNRHWTLTSEGNLVFTTYDATFHFVSGDLDAGTNTDNLSVGKFDAGTWNYPAVGARTATSTQALGVDGFSDFQLAEAEVPSAMVFLAALEGTQEVPPVMTNARGGGMFTLNLSQDTLSFNLRVSNLSGPLAAAHFHNAPPGEEGGVVRTLTSSFVDEVASGFWTGSDAEPLTPALVAELLAGNIYVNIHTAAFGEGEIRGQLNTGAAIALVASLSGTQEVPPVATTAYGSGAFTLHAEGGGLDFNVMVDDLSSSLIFAHFHNAAAGVNGGVVRVLTGDFVGNQAMGTWSATDANPLSPALVAELLAGRIYVNVHTETHTAGEIRGQLFKEMTSASGMVQAQVQCPATAFQGCAITVPVIIDVSGTSPAELLGAYNARLNWDPALLQYAGFSVGESPFNEAFVNENNTAVGELQFAQFVPAGASGAVTIINVTFDVVGDFNENANLTLNFLEMTAAGTRYDLIPIATVNGCSFQIEPGCILGDVTLDNSATIFDALLVATEAVGLPIPPEFLDRINQGCGDVTQDEDTTIFDALVIATFAVELPVDPFPVGAPLCP